LGNAKIFNKKLYVRQVVKDGTAGMNTAVPPPHDTSGIIENMTPEQMSQEIMTLHHKYDALVAVTVNLTVERDILNSTLEQTKRGQMVAHTSVENKGIVGGLEMGKCFFCEEEYRKVKLFKCGRCLIAGYCSKECQTADWKRHKPFCSKLISRQNE
jgi:hypothetical protein